MNKKKLFAWSWLVVFTSLILGSLIHYTLKGSAEALTMLIVIIFVIWVFTSVLALFTIIGFYD